MSHETGLSKKRVEFLTDGIFAVVMTLLVLEISIPQISSSHDDATIDSAAAETELLKGLFDLWPKLLSFGISFIILAIYWLAHHRQYYYIKHVNRTLIWINFMFLMAICLLPFSASLLGEYNEQQISIFVFGANSIIIGSLLSIEWWYALSHYSTLVHENLDPITKTTSLRRLLFGIIVYLIAIGISFVDVHLSVYFFALILISAFMPNKIMHRMTFGALAGKK